MPQSKKIREPAAAQSAPVVPSHTLGFHLKRAEQSIVARKAHGVRNLDLTESQCKVLGCLTGGVAKSCTQLSREGLVTSQTMTGIVKNLEAKGLVERHASPDHGRVMLVSLTPAGVERAAAAKSLSERVEHGLREALSEDDYRQLVKLLDRVADLAPGVDVSTSE
ncbi:MULTISPECIES: MarR family winged helix-turn-helix transcriptional regulator [Streptomyces]|uniref:MarR family winged helix-turn-helix transcriptional regulator n=1 Tax=Streptomyces kaempferi TaxID=333725 RepID=A0ABW3XVT4_9ACTN|nr:MULTISPECIES: MarR family winged helix-turn-helix transcriptional regulator [unclassified Streptomyces]QIY60622.1 winged helix-turn-helix transcriptional regulator [Streptomyces sp. RPA4-2]